MPLTLAALGLLTLLGAAVAAAVWPVNDPQVVEHSRAELDPDRPHLCNHHGDGLRHTHAFVIDDLHRRWPAEATLRRPSSSPKGSLPGEPKLLNPSLTHR
jgi:hypothetical protein